MRWRTEIGIGNVEFISKPEKGNVVVCGFFKKNMHVTLMTF